MLSDEWKMRMGNECEVSVCWLESALPNLTKVEGEKERGSGLAANKGRGWKEENIKGFSKLKERKYFKKKTN